MDPIQKALTEETHRFTLAYSWLQDTMSKTFFILFSAEEIRSITHCLMELRKLNGSAHLTTCDGVIVLHSQAIDIVTEVLDPYIEKNIAHYVTFLSAKPFLDGPHPIHITKITFAEQEEPSFLDTLSAKEAKSLLHKLQEKYAGPSSLEAISPSVPLSLVHALSDEQKLQLLGQLLYALHSDHCCYELSYSSQVEITLAWKSVFLPTFLHRLFLVFAKQGLCISSLHAAYTESPQRDKILLLALSCAPKETTEPLDTDALMEELSTLPYFEGLQVLENTFLPSKKCSGSALNIMKSIAYAVHQTLLHESIYAYSLSQITEDLCRYPSITLSLMDLFRLKFDVRVHDLAAYEQTYHLITRQIEHIVTTDLDADIRRKAVLTQFLSFIQNTLKTNAYHPWKTALSFRLDCAYFANLPKSIKEKFPITPYALFFMKGCHFLGFHIRFADLARGGLRTIILEDAEKALCERNHVLLECYNLAYTQHKKNKDIPEGGSKGILFIEPLPSSLAQPKQLLYHAQKAYIESLLSLVNCHRDGSLRATHILDYLQKPEYLYLGPDENMHSSMIAWIAKYSRDKQYFAKSAFISGKSTVGIHHKQFGVTSLGIHVYMEEALRFLGLDPKQDIFTIKMTGGPDGDVAGNQMLNLWRHCPKTAKLLTTVDVSGLIFDPQGLDLSILAQLFAEGKPIHFYPAAALSDGGYLIDFTQKGNIESEDPTVLCTTLIKRKLQKEWIPSSEATLRIKQTIHHTPVDIFIPAGGRPNTLHEGNSLEFLFQGKPSARAIIEGANLYLTQGARQILENLGCLIFKDSSANKGGVICSSYEVLAGLCLEEEEFLQHKAEIIKQISDIILEKSKKEATLLISTHKISNLPLSQISDEISQKIHHYKMQILAHLEPLDISSFPSLCSLLLAYAPPILRRNYPQRLLDRLPQPHQKAIISCYVASELIYTLGLSWHPGSDLWIPSIIEKFGSWEELGES